MKKIIAVLVLVLMAALWQQGSLTFWRPVSASETDVGLLNHSLTATGAQPTRAIFNGWAPLSRASEPKEMQVIVGSIASELGLNPAIHEITLRSTGDYSYAVLEHEDETKWLRIQVQYVNNQSYASIDIRQKDQHNIEQVYQKLSDALETVKLSDGSVIITACLEGTLNARLREGEKLDLLYNAFNAADASYLKGTEIGGLTVWSGYSPRFAFSAGGGEANLSLSLSYDDAIRQTVVRVATPVLPGSY